MGATRIKKKPQNESRWGQWFSPSYLKVTAVITLLVAGMLSVNHLFQPDTLPFRTIQVYGQLKWMKKDTLNQLVNSSTNTEKFVEHLRSMNVTHILMRTDLVDNHLKNNFSKKEIERFVVLAKKYWKLLYEDNGYAVWALRPESK